MSFIDYSNIIGYVEDKINIINTLSVNEAALVAAMANLLAGRNNPPSNMLALETYLQGKENLVTDADLVKDVTLLLGASLPSKNTVWKMREFLTNDNFTVPLNIAGGVVYVTGCGGGGSGAAWITNITNTGVSGACSGCYVSKRPVQVVAGDVVPVTIGAGGVPVVASAITSTQIDGVAGGNSSFGSLVIPGGTGGTDALGGGLATSKPMKGGWVGGYQTGNTVFLAQNSISYQAGQRSSGSSIFALGSAGGAFGNATDSVASSGSSVTAANAAANTGAGGGGAVFFTASAPSITVTSGAGGSGRIIVEWQEFV